MFPLAFIFTFALMLAKVALPAATFPWLTWWIVFLPLGLAVGWFVFVFVIVFIIAFVLMLCGVDFSEGPRGPKVCYP